ncbi:MAG: hypothetical protein HZB51_32080 [Chloroflexi bacterium]|nr:hypothetical protein [Chloroflexota bacterium]
MILVVTMLFASACQIATPTFRPPNQNELQTFARDRNITPIVDKLLDDSLVILYETNTSFGYYLLRVQEPQGLLSAVSNGSAAKSDQPILTIGQLTGTQPFVAVVIQDMTLRAKTIAIEIAIDSQNYLTSTTDGKSGVVIVSPSPVQGWKTVTLYDAQGRGLYSQSGNPLQQLRVLNRGSEDIKGLTILFPGTTADAEAVRIEFGDVPADKTTDYRNATSGVYRYSAFAYTLDGRLINQAVMDWVGESPMKGAKFTYRLELNSRKEPGGQIQLIEVLVDEP